jgi:hypothetical protein
MHFREKLAFGFHPIIEVLPRLASAVEILLIGPVRNTLVRIQEAFSEILQAQTLPVGKPPHTDLRLLLILYVSRHDGWLHQFSPYRSGAL